jgi:hypothetical protein
VSFEALGLECPLDARRNGLLMVDRAYVRSGLNQGDGRMGLFEGLVVPTLRVVPPDSPMAPRPEEVHNDPVRTVVVPRADPCLCRDQSVRYLRAVSAFCAEVARAGQARDEENLTKKVLPFEVVSRVRVARLAEG